ncbi:MAG: hypothetical protein AAF561_14505 [Planctomycetota bacterium]
MSWIRGLSLLRGGSKPHPLCGLLERPILTLPISPTKRISDLWVEFADTIGLPESRAIDVLAPHFAPPLSKTSPEVSGRLRLVPDRSSYRGTAGLLRDAHVDDGDPSDWLLVSLGRHAPLAHSAAIIATLDEPKRNKDVVLLHADGVLTGTWLIRRRTLESVPSRGYVDFAEQHVSRVSADGGLAVINVQRPLLQPIRSLDAYLNLATAHATDTEDRAEGAPRFGFIEGQTSVPASVRLLDSIVLKGAKLPARCTVVRSVIGRHAVIRPGETILHRTHV